MLASFPAVMTLTTLCVRASSRARQIGQATRDGYDAVVNVGL